MSDLAINAGVRMHAPLASARIGAVGVQTRVEGDYYTSDWIDQTLDINLELDDRGAIAPGYASLADAVQGIRHVSTQNYGIDASESYFVAKVGDGWYVAPGERYSSVFGRDGVGTRITDVRANIDIDELHVVKLPGYSDRGEGIQVLDASALVAGSGEVN